MFFVKDHKTGHQSTLHNVFAEKFQLTLAEFNL